MILLGFGCCLSNLCARSCPVATDWTNAIASVALKHFALYLLTLIIQLLPVQILHCISWRPVFNFYLYRFCSHLNHNSLNYWLNSYCYISALNWTLIRSLFLAFSTCWGFRWLPPLTQQRFMAACVAATAGGFMCPAGQFAYVWASGRLGQCSACSKQAQVSSRQGIAYGPVQCVNWCRLDVYVTLVLMRAELVGLYTVVMWATASFCVSSNCAKVQMWCCMMNQK